MNKFTLIAALLFSLNAYADQYAVTDNGKVVLLSDDGTWKYASGEADKSKSIEFNKITFAKANNQSFLLKSTKNKAAAWIDPKKWTFRKTEGNTEASEYKFKHKEADVYGMLITEQIEIGLENLAQLALENAKKFAPNARIVSQEYRMVNGIKVIRMRIDASAQGANFTYVGHYMSDKSGSTQFMVYTSTNLIDRNLAEIDEFLNGFSVQQ
ncbi:hypothetical protein ABT392_09210 [Paucibacter sp. JuS9]|uniref:hypothetical protein n=1 Tax=Roseateles TaxID=93681 RepID=UPI002FE6155D